MPPKPVPAAPSAKPQAPEAPASSAVPEPPATIADGTGVSLSDLPAHRLGVPPPSPAHDGAPCPNCGISMIEVLPDQIRCDYCLYSWVLP